MFFQDRRDLVAEDRIASDPVGVVEDGQPSSWDSKRHGNKKGASWFETSALGGEPLRGSWAPILTAWPVDEQNHRDEIVALRRARKTERGGEFPPPGRPSPAFLKRREIEGDRRCSL